MNLACFLGNKERTFLGRILSWVTSTSGCAERGAAWVRRLAVPGCNGIKYIT